MKYQLHCFGTAGYHPNEARHTSSYFLPRQGIALDAGTGFFRSFPLIETPELHVLLSHAHLDHIVGLTFLWNAYRNKNLKQVFVHAEQSKINAIQQHIFTDEIFPALPNIRWNAIGPDQSFDLNDTRVETFRLEHPGGSLGFVLTNSDHKFAYVTDTTTSVDADYWPLVRNADLLLHECNFRAQEHDFAVRTGHSDLGTLFKALHHHKLRRILLTHFNTVDDDLRLELNQLTGNTSQLQPINIQLAYDGICVDY